VAGCAADTSKPGISTSCSQALHVGSDTWMELCLDSLCIELSFSIYRQIGQSAGLHAANLPGNPGHLSDTSYSDAGSTTIMGDGSSRLTQGSELLVRGEGTQGL